MNDAAAPQLSIVVPAFNEAQNIGPVVEEISNALAERQLDRYELLLVDDGSADGTWKAISAIGAADARIRITRHDRNRGFGAALRTGYAMATGELVTLITGDGEFDPREVLGLVDLMGDADLVLSRRIRSEDIATAQRSLLSSGFAALVRWMLGFDTSSVLGVYVIRNRVLKQLPLRSDTGLVNIELVMACVAKKCSVKYGELHIRARLSGESKVTNARTVMRTLVEILKLRLSLAFR